MTYTSKWERLSDALDRVMKSTVSREQAESDICRAISDGAIGLRAKLASHAIRPLKLRAVVEGKNLYIPAQLESNHLDWEKSRPTIPWSIRDLPPFHSGPWHLEWIELSKADVTRELLPSEKSSVETGSEGPIKPKRKERTRSKRKAAEDALEALYPDGTPPQHVQPNDQLFDKVIKYLKNNDLPQVSRETVLRAAKRRK